MHVLLFMICILIFFNTSTTLLVAYFSSKNNFLNKPILLFFCKLMVGITVFSNENILRRRRYMLLNYNLSFHYIYNVKLVYYLILFFNGS